MAGAVCVPSRLSTWLWQPEGLDLDALCSIRTARLAARLVAAREEAEAAEEAAGGDERLAAMRAARWQARQVADEPESFMAEEFGFDRAYRDAAAPAPEKEPEPEPEQGAVRLLQREPEIELFRRPPAPAQGLAGMEAGAPDGQPPPLPHLNVGWLFAECQVSLFSMGLDDATETQVAELAIKTKQLLSSKRGGDEIQGELLDMLGFERLDFITELLSNRATLSGLSVPSQPKKLLKVRAARGFVRCSIWRSPFWLGFYQ